MTGRLFATETARVHLAATAACKGLRVKSTAITASLIGAPVEVGLADEVADACERAGLSVHRGRHVVTVSAGTHDVDAVWRAARANIRRRHDMYHAIARRRLDAAAVQREEKRARDSECAEREAEDASVSDVKF